MQFLRKSPFLNLPSDIEAKKLLINSTRKVKSIEGTILCESLIFITFATIRIASMVFNTRTYR